MLKLNLRTHRPAFAEVIAEIDNHVRNVEDPVARIIVVFVGQLVAIGVVAVEVATHRDFAIATHTQSVAAGMVHHAVGSIFLCIGLQGKGHRAG